jgi:RNA polymerase sigma-70 factor (ECF subfamily)
VAWLYRVVRTRAINASRSARRRKHHETAAALPQSAWFTPSPGNALDAKEAAAALSELPDQEREVVVAHVWGGLTFQQIGQLTDTSGSTAHRRYVSALAALRQKLGMPCLEND